MAKKAVPTSVKNVKKPKPREINKSKSLAQTQAIVPEILHHDDETSDITPEQIYKIPEPLESDATELTFDEEPLIRAISITKTPKTSSLDP